MGAVSTPRGLRGEIKVKSFTANPDDIAAYGPLWDEKATREYRLKVVGQASGHVVVRIDGVNDRTAAEALKGLKLYAPRGALPEPDDEEYYHTDLIGLNAVLDDGAALGKVMAVRDFGAGEFLEITDGPQGGVMVPFSLDAVPEVDIEGGRIVVHLPEELVATPDDAGPIEVEEK